MLQAHNHVPRPAKRESCSAVSNDQVKRDDMAAMRAGYAHTAGFFQQQNRSKLLPTHWRMTGMPDMLRNQAGKGSGLGNAGLTPCFPFSQLALSKI